MTHIFEVLEEIGDGLALTVGEDRLVQTIAGFCCDVILDHCSKLGVKRQSRTSTA